MRTKADTKDNTSGAEVARLTESLSKALEPTVKQIKTFNSGIEPIIKRINEYTQEFSKAFEPILERINEMAERLRLFKIEYEREYTIIRTRYDAQFKKDDYITPLDADEYLLWLMCKNDSNPKANLIEEAKKAYNFTLFHNYMIRCLKSDWDIIKELDYWDKQHTEQPVQNKEEVKKKMQLGELDNLFNPKQVDSYKLDLFKRELMKFVPDYDKKQIAVLAWVIYDGEILHKNVKPKHFNKWQNLFCDILGVEESTYKPKMITEEEKTKMKGIYYYLFESIT